MGYRQMAVDKEAISLSRVYSYDSKCTCPYSTRYLSSLILNIIILILLVWSCDANGT